MQRRTENWIIAGIVLSGALVAAAVVFFVPGSESEPLPPQFPHASDIPVPSHLPDIEILLTPPVPTTSLPQEKLPAPDIARMKTQGCIADGLLSGYGRTSKDTKVVNNSECYYLHRAIETWLDPPDFEKARSIKGRITKDDMIYGMFLAEAIDKKAKYDYRAEGRRFDFGEMCRKNSKNFWGEHTCKPTFDSREYRAYLQQITRDAMDMGVQAFLFGQIHFQDDLDDPRAAEIVADMRAYAEAINLDIVIGAQTNDIQKESYLRTFDFIEGGVGLSTQGTVENGPCFSRWYKKPGDWCWALLWHEDFAAKANHVFVHLDWSAQIGDDMSTFTRMDAPTRHQALRSLHARFTQQDIGFLLPVLAPLPKNNGGCHGPKKRFYSPSNKYKCQDEDVVNEILETRNQ